MRSSGRVFVALLAISMLHGQLPLLQGAEARTEDGSDAASRFGGQQERQGSIQGKLEGTDKYFNRHLGQFQASEDDNTVLLIQPEKKNLKPELAIGTEQRGAEEVMMGATDQRVGAQREDSDLAMIQAKSAHLSHNLVSRQEVGTGFPDSTLPRRDLTVTNEQVEVPATYESASPIPEGVDTEATSPSEEEDPVSKLPWKERIKLKLEERWDLVITIAITLVILLLLKIQHNASIRHLRRQLGDAEYKIQQAILHLEKQQAEKLAKGEEALNDREKRRKSLALPLNPDISHQDLSDIGESKMELSFVEKHESSFQDSLKKLSNKIMGRKPVIKKSFTIKPAVPIDLIDAESLESRVKEKEILAKGNYELKSDLTETQSRRRKERLRLQVLEELAADHRKKRREEAIKKREEEKKRKIQEGKQLGSLLGFPNDKTGGPGKLNSSLSMTAIVSHRFPITTRRVYGGAHTAIPGSRSSSHCHKKHDSYSDIKRIAREVKFQGTQSNISIMGGGHKGQMGSSPDNNKISESDEDDLADVSSSLDLSVDKMNPGGPQPFAPSSPDSREKETKTAFGNRNFSHDNGPRFPGTDLGFLRNQNTFNERMMEPPRNLLGNGFDLSPHSPNDIESYIPESSNPQFSVPQLPPHPMEPSETRIASPVDMMKQRPRIRLNKNSELSKQDELQLIREHPIISPVIPNTRLAGPLEERDSPFRDHFSSKNNSKLAKLSKEESPETTEENLDSALPKKIHMANQDPKMSVTIENIDQGEINQHQFRPADFQNRNLASNSSFTESSFRSSIPSRRFERIPGPPADLELGVLPTQQLGEPPTTKHLLPSPRFGTVEDAVGTEKRLDDQLLKLEPVTNQKMGSKYVQTKMKSSLLDQWLDQYWKRNLQLSEEKSFNVLEIDKKIHELISYLLILGEEEIEGHRVAMHSQGNILKLQEEINAVLVEIKPGLFNILFKAYSQDMISAYLHKVKRKVFYKKPNPKSIGGSKFFDANDIPEQDKKSFENSLASQDISIAVLNKPPPPAASMGQVMSMPASNSPKRTEVIPPTAAADNSQVIVASKSALLTDMEMLKSAREALKKKTTQKSRNPPPGESMQKTIGLTSDNPNVGFTSDQQLTMRGAKEIKFSSLSPKEENHGAFPGFADESKKMFSTKVSGPQLMSGNESDRGSAQAGAFLRQGTNPESHFEQRRFGHLQFGGLGLNSNKHNQRSLVHVGPRSLSIFDDNKSTTRSPPRHRQERRQPAQPSQVQAIGLQKSPDNKIRYKTQEDDEKIFRKIESNAQYRAQIKSLQVLRPPSDENFIGVKRVRYFDYDKKKTAYFEKVVVPPKSQTNLGFFKPSTAEDGKRRNNFFNVPSIALDIHKPESTEEEDSRPPSGSGMQRSRSHMTDKSPVMRMAPMAGNISSGKQNMRATIKFGNVPQLDSMKSKQES